MRGHIINKQTLFELYPEGIETVGAYDASGRFALSATGSGIKKGRVESLPDEIQVEVVQKGSSFSLIRLVHIAFDSVLTVPTSILKNIEMPSAIELFRPVLNKMFPDGRYAYAKNGDLYLHYPKLTLTNTLGMTHDITDLVVRLKLMENTLFGDTMDGTRFTFSKPELSIGYIHSHLHASHYSFSGFCRGPGTTFDKLLLSMRKYNTVMDFEMFLVQLEKYLTWESLEGNPFISISGFFDTIPIATPDLFVDPEDPIVQDMAMYWLAQMRDKGAIVGNYNLFDPSSDPIASFEGEKAAVRKYEQELLDRGYLAPYDEAKRKFVRENHMDVDRIPDAVYDTSEWLRRETGWTIKPKLMQSDKVYERPVTVNRLIKNAYKTAVHHINKMLQEGAIYERDNIVTEGDSTNDAAASIASSLSSQPVPVGEGVERTADLPAN